jgi:hypothetical protein
VVVKRRFWQSPRGQLLGLVALGTPVRAGWWWARVDVIESEGAQYARLAQTLAQDEGYRGILGGVEVMFPPAYPLLIAGLGSIASDLELAARLISLLAGLGTIAALFAITRRLAGPRAGLVAGAIACLHPLLIALSVSVYVEGLASATALGSVACALYSTSWRPALMVLLSGLLLGIAYLSRPELVLLALPLLVYCGWSRWRERRRLGAGAWEVLLFTLGCGAVATPQVVRLTELTGSVRWEGKTGANELINRRMAAGMTYPEAARGLDVSSDFERAAPYLGGPDLWSEQLAFLRARPGAAPEAAPSLLRELPGRVPQVLRFWWWAIQQWTSLWKIPVGLAALLASLSFRPRGARRKAAALLMLSLLALHAAFPLGVRFLWSRYGFPLLPMLVPWLAIGTLAAADWLAPRLKNRWAAAPRASLVTVLGGWLVLLTLLQHRVSGLDDFRQSQDEEVEVAGREIARRFAATPERSRALIVGYSAPVAFYAGATLAYLPYTKDVSAALAYVRWKRPDFIVARASEAQQTPYLLDWLQHGVPDACAIPAYSSTGETGALKVWRWTCPEP